MIFTTARITSIPSASKAALKILIDCVLGSICRHTYNQKVPMRQIRNIKDIELDNMNIIYPILIYHVKHKAPILSLKLLLYLRKNHKKQHSNLINTPF